MMLSGGEVAVKLAGSAAKNAAAMLLALARNHKKVYGKTSLKRILQQTRDIRTFSLTPEQYREFSRQAKDKVLFAGIQDKEQPDAPIDLVIPTTGLFQFHSKAWVFACKYLYKYAVNAFMQQNIYSHCHD